LQSRANDDPEETMTLTTSVKMYTTKWCGYCVHTKRYLDSKGVAYEEIDIEAYPEYGERIEQATGGFKTVPTIEIDGHLLVNPSRRELDEALKATA
jgi:mycoredoxin